MGDTLSANVFPANGWQPAPVNCEKAYSTPKIRIVFGDFILSITSMFQGLCQQRDGHGDRGAGGGGERGHPAPLPEVRPGNITDYTTSGPKNIPLRTKLSRLNAHIARLF